MRGLSSGAQPETTSRASSAVEMISISSPVSARTRARNSVAIGGAAAGLGGDVAAARDAPKGDLAGADLERVERARDRLLGQRAGRGQPFAEPDDAREGVDDAKAAAGRPRHQQPAIVGAEIERGDGGAKARGERQRSDRAVGSPPAAGCAHADRTARKFCRHGSGDAAPDRFPAVERLFHGRQAIPSH